VAVAQFNFHEIRGCTEISFSNGGHLYAINDEENNIQVFKFWQNERPLEWVFTAHTGLIKSIQWLEDDTGFVSAGATDHQVILWKLKPNEEGTRQIWTYRQ
jgi:WD40 repeat protein